MSQGIPILAATCQGEVNRVYQAQGDYDFCHVNRGFYISLACEGKMILVLQPQSKSVSDFSQTCWRAEAWQDGASGSQEGGASGFFMKW